ncbi:MAG TPA: DUF3883 domain-containing protein [Thermodesulfobacteriota bacterium]
MPNDVEQKAMKVVARYEKRRTGKGSKDVSGTGCGYDIKSGNRLIEVKGFYNERYPSISLYKKLEEQLGKGKNHYYIYVVYDITKKPKLKILEPKVIWGNIEVDTRYIVRGKVYRRIPDENL